MTAPLSRGDLDCLFRPRTVAVVGASRRKQTIGREILHNLVEGEFAGVAYPVNPKQPVIHSMKAYQTVSEIPEDVDLCVVVIPGAMVLEVAEQCGQKGVKSMVVISAGFREIGPDGLEREEKLVDIARRYSMRVVGPNCMGIINTDPDIRLNASFAAATPIPGSAAFISQSGALGEAILAQARTLGLGISMFASLGNRCDVDASDLIAYWEDAPRTRIILLYIESVGSPERFLEVARRVSPKKPIIVVKAGRSRRGALAAASHTGALAGRDQAFDSLFEQAGVLRVGTLKELFDVATAFVQQEVPQGDRVAIVSNAGGPAILATDACEGHGLAFAELQKSTKEALAKALPPEASVVNPIDLIASADATSYDAALELVLADEGVDSVIVIFVSPVMIDAHAVAEVIVKRAQSSTKPVLACILGKQRNDEAMEALRAGGIPIYRFPEEAARALSSLCRYRHHRDRDPGELISTSFEVAKVKELLDQAQRDERGWLRSEDAFDVLRAAGLDIVSHRKATSPSDAVAQGYELGFPVVAKVDSARVLHKSESGGVHVDLRNGDELYQAAQSILDTATKVDPEAQVLIQPMLRDSHEVILGGVRDPQTGPLILFGLGGIFVEVMGDIATRIAPLTDRDAHDMVRAIRGLPILEGARGGPGANLPRIEKTIGIVSRLFTEFTQIAEMDLNPMMVGENHCVAVDARIRLAAPSSLCRK